MTPFNMALRGDPKEIGLGKKGELHDCLGDWLALIRSLVKYPTSIHEIVSISVDYYGYCDACNTGAGGVWLPFNSSLDLFVWRVECPPDIAKKLASYNGISISNDEGAGVLLQQMALENEV